MIYLSTYNTSYGQKKGWESKCQFDSQLLKIKNRPKLCACNWKALNESYNFALDLAPIRGLRV